MDERISVNHARKGAPEPEMPALALSVPESSSLPPQTESVLQHPLMQSLYSTATIGGENRGERTNFDLTKLFWAQYLRTAIGDLNRQAVIERPDLDQYISLSREGSSSPALDASPPSLVVCTDDDNEHEPIITCFVHILGVDFTRGGRRDEDYASIFTAAFNTAKSYMQSVPRQRWVYFITVVGMELRMHTLHNTGKGFKVQPLWCRTETGDELILEPGVGDRKLFWQVSGAKHLKILHLLVENLVQCPPGLKPNPSAEATVTE